MSINEIQDEIIEEFEMFDEWLDRYQLIIDYANELKKHPMPEADKNDRYKVIRHIMDRRIIGGYKLWKTNYMAYDLVNHGFKYTDKYTPEDLEAFTIYTEKQLDLVEPSLSRNELRDIFLRIYGNPVVSREKLDEELAEEQK